jgi:ubiquitin-like-conjugating enzyme ATG3
MFSAVSKDSKFESTGTLTPEEFIAAGDQLVSKFPTWQWAPAANKSLERSHLPPEKQYLVTKGVPCLSRVRDLDAVLASSSHVDKEDGWLVAGVSEEEVKPPTSQSTSSKPPQLSEFADLDSMLLGQGQEEDKGVTKPPQLSKFPSNNIVEDNLRARSYDLSITWDKYYQTPRLWLFGYDVSGQPLTDEQVYEDVLSEYITKTVTVDTHPSSGVRTASIHPCQHAKMMLKVVEEWKSNNHPVRPDLSLFVFLKFISGVVPTINYDFTMDIEM